MARRSTADAKAADRRKGFEAVAKSFKEFRPAREVLKVVRAVPTWFPQFDHAVRVGGLPIERFMLVHGPSNEGKSLMSLGLVGSFLARDHFALYIDAERTTPSTWAEQVMGNLVDHPYFLAERPETYEATVGKVRSFLVRLATLKETGKVPEDTSAIIICDSLRKLVPADLMEEILKAEKDEGEGKRRPGKGKQPTVGRDRSAQLKAKMNATWMDELVPLLEKSGAGFVAIAREMVDPDAQAWAKKFGNDYKVGGGGAVYYDASLSMRTTRASWVTQGDGPDRKVYGERHRITIKKTKVAGKDDKVSVAHFHSSNGTLVPFGLDRARDVLELGQRFGLVKAPKRGWLTWEKSRWQGEHTAVVKLTADHAALQRLEAQVRERFADHKPVEHNEDGEVE